MTSPNPTLIGASASTRAVRDEIDLAARSNAKVLITGETGVGKDLVARLIHQRSARRNGAIAMLNCAGLPDSLLESELFGHQRGSFTDAYRDKPGILEAASGGTVFLDEVGEMSQRMQAVLLRFLETGELQRVGADRVHAKADVRIVAATNRNLLGEIAAGRFRQDLYYRLNVLTIQVPPLRDRRDDVAPLLAYYVAHFAQLHAVAERRFSAAAIDLMTAYDWPGNVRQLKNVVERVVLKAHGSRAGNIDVPDVARDLQTTGGASALAPMTATAAGDKQPEVDALYSRMVHSGESFWAVVYTPFMRRDLTRRQLTEVVRRGLAHSAGSYRRTVQLFNMPGCDYKRFLSFLRQHECHVPFHAFRQSAPGLEGSGPDADSECDGAEPRKHIVAAASTNG